LGKLCEQTRERMIRATSRLSRSVSKLASFSTRSAKAFEIARALVRCKLRFEHVERLLAPLAHLVNRYKSAHGR
jgi:hypothetical protein